jgi:hypothetical protein
MLSFPPPPSPAIVNLSSPYAFFVPFFCTVSFVFPIRRPPFFFLFIILFFPFSPFKNGTLSYFFCQFFFQILFSCFYFLFLYFPILSSILFPISVICISFLLLLYPHFLAFSHFRYLFVSFWLSNWEYIWRTGLTTGTVKLPTATGTNF